MIIAVFVDGLGLAPPGAPGNPIYRLGLDVIPWLLDQAVPLDASMGVDGLPQSATGQSALFTGANAAALVGRHYQGFPGPTLRRLLMKGTFYTRIRDAGRNVAFLNTYSRAYLKALAAGSLRASCSTLTAAAAGLTLRDATNLRRGDGVHHDLTADALRAQGEGVPRHTPQSAAAAALRVAASSDLTLLEYFITDPAGHSGDVEQAARVLRRLDDFLAALISGLDGAAGTSTPGPAPSMPQPASGPPRLVLFSDHGNIEDMSCRTHTSNPVPLAVWPPCDLVHSCASVTDVAGLLVALATGSC
jgi:hypothetical protein